MGDGLRVLVLGTGQMGVGIARLLLKKNGLDLVGSFARRVERAGHDLGGLIGLNEHIGISVSNDLSLLIEQTQPEVAIQATCSRLSDAEPEIITLLQHGVNVISIAEEMAFPSASSPAKSELFHQMAKEHGVSLLGTGVNPGFVLDLLVIVLTGVCSNIDSIVASRVNDLSPYGPSVLSTQGVGLTPEAFEQGLADGSVVGHFGFAESIGMIAHALGWDIDRIEQRREPIISKVMRNTPFVTVEPGEVAGCHHTAIAYRNNRPAITLNHPQQIHPELEGIETGDEIVIHGSPEIKIAGSPEIPGGEATIALAVNMIPRVLNAQPGLYSMADLQVPAALMGDLNLREIQS